MRPRRGIEGRTEAFEEQMRISMELNDAPDPGAVARERRRNRRRLAANPEFHFMWLRVGVAAP